MSEGLSQVGRPEDTFRKSIEGRNARAWLSRWAEYKWRESFELQLAFSTVRFTAVPNLRLDHLLHSCTLRCNRSDAPSSDTVGGAFA